MTLAALCTSVLQLIPALPAFFQGSYPCTLRPLSLQDADSKRGWVCLRWLLRYSAALVVVAVIAVGVVSLVLNDAAIARSCHGCEDIDCVQIRDWWSCDSLATLQPQASCLFDQNSNATTTITCPSVSRTSHSVDIRAVLLGILVHCCNAYAWA